MKIGIIGFGSFGKLMAELLAPHAEVVVISRRKLSADGVPDGVAIGSYEVLGICDAVIIAVELEGFEAVCEQLKPIVKPDTIVMDVCSVKIKPSKIMQKILGGKCKLLCTHPMFGPQSVTENKGTHGLKIVWHELEGGPFLSLRAIFENDLQLKIVDLTPDEHDKQMAWVHGLTFFVGRGLVNMNIPETVIDTGYFRKLLDLHDLEQKHSLELFNTVERGNPYAKRVRDGFISTLQKLEQDIDERT